MFVDFFLISLIILLLTFFYWIFLCYKRAFNYWPERNVPQLKPYFPLGNFNINGYKHSGFIFQDIYRTMKKTNAKYCGIHVFTVPIFMPLKPDLYKEITVKNFQYFEDHGAFHDEEIDPMSAMLISLEGDQWRNVRRKMTPAFSVLKLKQMLPLVQKCGEDLHLFLEKSEKINAHDTASRFASDVICSCAFGIEGNSLNDPNSEIQYYGRRLVELNVFEAFRMICGGIAPVILKTFRMAYINPKNTDFFVNILKETMAYREKHNIERNDLLDALLKMYKEGELTFNQIAAQVFLFFFAGYETSSITIAFCMYELARNPEIQDKVREEILEKVQENNGEITYDLLNNLEYMDKVISETMRMYPAITMLNRICTKSFQIPNSDLILEKGVRVVISLLGLHYDPEFYPEPEIFNPERFSDEEKSKRPPFTFLPFGEGPRNCLGWKFSIMETKLSLYEFLKDFTYTVHPSTTKVEIVNNGHLLGIKNKIWLIPTKIQNK